MSNNSFKSSLFGGFNRQDVVNYIENAAKTSQNTINELEKECAALKEQLTAATEQQTLLQQKLDTADQELSQLRSTAEEKEVLSYTCQQLQAQVSALTERLAAAEPLAQEYQQVKQHISTYELEAQRRADALSNRSRAQLLQMLSAVSDLSLAAQGQLERTTQHITEELHKLDVNLSQLPLAFNKYLADLERLKKEAEQP